MGKPAAIGIIFSENRKEVLLVLRRDIPIWVLPAGGIDEGESPDKAAVREVEEETGYSSKISRKVGEYYPINRLAEFSHVFECEITGGAPTTGAETKEVRFWPLSFLPKIMAPPHVDWIKDALENHPTLLKKPIESVSYSAFFKALIKHPLIIFRFILTKFGIHLNQ